MLKVIDGRVPVLTLKEYFTDHSVLRIPSWQRDYSWEATDEGQVGILLEDLQTFAQDQNSTEYLMGSVILCETPSSEHLVIDGQQRSLTTTIFLMAAIKYARNHNLIDVHNPAHTALITELHSCVNSGAVGINFSSRLVMNNPAADAVIKKIYQWSQLEDSAGDDILTGAGVKTKSEANLIEVAQYIYHKRFSTESVFPKDNFLDALKKIVNSVKLVVLTLDNQSEALRVYDRINNRGMVLSSADLIKNIIFMNVSDEEFDQVSDAWLEMAKELNGTGKARLQDPKFLLRMLAGIDTGAKVTYDGLVDFWSGKIEKNIISPLDFANDLPIKANALRNLATHQLIYPAGEVQEWQEPTPVKTTHLHVPYELNSVQHYAVLLAGLHFEKAETLSKLSRQVAARSMLYIFAQERTGMFEQIIPAWANAVSLLPKDSDPDDLDDVYRTKAFLADNPVDVLEANMRNNMASWTYENSSDKKRIRSLFAFLNLELNLHFNAPELMRTRKKPGEKTGWDLDHIMPKSLVAEKWVHKIGNLTLLAPDENKWASNTPPINKITENLYSTSAVYMTKICDDLGKQTPLERTNILEVFDEAGISINYKIDIDWNEKSTEARTQFLIDWACYVLVGRYR